MHILAKSFYNKYLNYIKRNALNLILISFLLNSFLSLHKSSYYIRGILIDYLIPKIYLNQLLLILLFLPLLSHFVFKYKKYYFLFFTFICLNLLLSLNPLYSVSYFLDKVFYLFFLPFIFSIKNLSFNKKILLCLNILYILLFIVQTYSKSSVLPFFPTGVFSYNGIAPKLDFVTFFHTKTVTALGNFSHSNVFASFLVFLNLIWLKYFKSYFFPVTNVLICFLLGSLSSFLLGVFFIFYFLLKNYQYKYIKFSLIFVISIIFLYLFPFVFKQVSFSARLIDYDVFYNLFGNHFLFGTGIGGSIPAYIEYEMSRGLLINLQPIHNIFLLYLLEFGIFGLFFLVYFFFSHARYLRITPFLIYIVFYFLIDHFLYTLNQGNLLLLLTMYLHKSIIDTRQT